MIQVSSNLYRGPRPSCEENFRQMAEAGIKTIVNLESGAYEEFHNDWYERAIPQDFGLSRIDIPCSDVQPPESWQVDKFLKVVKNYGPVYVHCLHGADRTGFMVACYRMLEQKWSSHAAIKEMFDQGFHKMPYLIWVSRLRRLGDLQDV